MQKYANLVELEKYCQTPIFSQNFVLIQPKNERAKNLQKLQKNANFANLTFANQPCSAELSKAGAHLRVDALQDEEEQEVVRRVAHRRQVHPRHGLPGHEL